MRSCKIAKYFKTSFSPTVLSNFKDYFQFRINFSCYLSSKGSTTRPVKAGICGPYPTAYDPKQVESCWYEYWEKNNFFHWKNVSELSFNEKRDALIFSVVLPPPNVTGSLHIGHALTATIQDCICRWHRMRGKAVAWIPGFDHGGIATQTVVEKKLLKERKLTRHDIGKEELLKEVNKWKVATQKDIELQLKRLGSSLDFRYTSFTLDENASKAVVKVFVDLFDEGLIYRKKKLVNWSCEIRSVISDIEVDYLEIPGRTKMRIPGLKEPFELGIMDFFYYPVVDSNGEKILVATSRLETMLGDTAVAVNPDDSRYSNLIGKCVQHPYTGEKLSIIADPEINKEFGTGAMKVTPAHDFKDYELGEKHNLKLVDVFSDEGTVCKDIENFKGKHRLVVRQLLRKSLEAKGLFKESRSHTMHIPFCSRTGDIVEPRLKDQWYLNCAAMGNKAVQAVKDGRLRFHPNYHEKVWFEWFRHLKDWCISRQLWWGHRIPAYKVYHASTSKETFYWIAATSEDEAVSKAVKKFGLSRRKIKAVQDEDVLDTWFSSALYPLTALGWPTNTENLKHHLPLSLIETGFDILFFWVARMVMLGEHVTGKLPFHDVLLHGMVCDSHGRKMSKSLGNTVDPLDIVEGIPLENLIQRVKDSQIQDSLTPEEVKSAISGYKQNFPNGIPECGTDGFRYSLLSHDIQNQKINIDVKQVRICRHFCNKIWQGIRLFTKVIEPCSLESLIPLTTQEGQTECATKVDHWILSRLAGLVAISNSSFESYQFHAAAFAMRQFWVQNFCDVYLEYVKNTLTAEEDRRLYLCRVMLTCIETFLRITSPVMPFLSEELYQRLSYMTSIRQSNSVTLLPYPTASNFPGWRDMVLEADMHTVTDLIWMARSLKAKHGATKMRPAVTIAVEEANTLESLSPFSKFIASLARLECVTFHQTQGQEFFEHHPQDSWVFQTHDRGITLIMDLGDKEEKSMSRLDHIRVELDKLNKLLSHSEYRKNASLSVQEKTMAKKASLEGELQKLLSQFGKNEEEQQKKSSRS